MIFPSCMSDSSESYCLFIDRGPTPTPPPPPSNKNVSRPQQYHLVGPHNQGLGCIPLKTPSDINVQPHIQLVLVDARKYLAGWLANKVFVFYLEREYILYSHTDL